MNIVRVLGGPHTREDMERVQRYLPDNYHAERHIDPSVGGDGAMSIFVVGEDYAGWTMEDYVRPRLASGLIWLEREEEK